MRWQSGRFGRRDQRKDHGMQTTELGLLVLLPLASDASVPSTTRLRVFPIPVQVAGSWLLRRVSNRTSFFGSRYGRSRDARFTIGLNDGLKVSSS
jgi:hypothetical protein